MRAFLMIVFVSLLPISALADERLVRLYAPPELVETGLLKHILPRFSLKTSVRVELIESPSGANMTFGPDGRAIFEGAGAVWHMSLVTPDHPGTDRLSKWHGSDIGQRTVTAYAPNGEALFKLPSEKQVEVVAAEPDGDAKLGYEVSRAMCARCHAVDEAGKKNDIGSTPSFFVLRSFPDWQDRFGAFYALKPHPAFTQITDVTPPFPDDRPPPIVPIELSIDDLEEVMAYVAALKAADLGAPLEHQ